MNHDLFTSPGRDHILRGIPNEDRVRSLSRDGLTTALVCDGAGSFGSGAEAAEVVCRTVTAFLHTQFGALFSAPSAWAREQLAAAVEEALGGYALGRSIPERELACTILAAAVHEDGRCLCFHLGDGIILEKTGASRYLSVVSCPMTGLVPHSTYLTMNCDLRHYLRFYRWESTDLEQLLLLSDGAAEHLVRLRGGAGWVYTPAKSDIGTIRTLLHRANPRDDHSAALISR